MSLTREQKKILSNPRAILNNRVKLKLDSVTLDCIINFICNESTLRTRRALSNIKKLFYEVLDESVYDGDKLHSIEKIWIIKTFLYGKLEEDLMDEVALQYCLDNEDCPAVAKVLINDFRKEWSKIKKNPVSYKDARYLLKRVDDVLQYGYSLALKETMREIIDQLDDEDMGTFKNIQDDLYLIATSIINIKRMNTSNGNRKTFSLDQEVFENVLDESIRRLKDNNRVFRTGIEMLNMFLSPGFMSKRLYCFFALPGMGKSTMLLKSAIDIKKYNRPKPRDPEKRPAILLLILENDITETVERMYNMVVDNDDIRNYHSDKIKQKFKECEVFQLTEENPTDIIIKEFKNRELDTNDIHTLLKDMEDDGMEPVALIVDYLKRLRPAEKALNEKEELKNITNELKEIAKFWDIPVITAHQLNRAGASVIDAAINSEKADATRLIGRENIGSAWEIQENSDWTCIVNPEKKYGTNEHYLTFKLIKRRYKSADPNIQNRTKTYFNHPFYEDNFMRLIDDVELGHSVSVDSLKPTLDGMINPNNVENEKNREMNLQKYKDGYKGDNDMKKSSDMLAIPIFDKNQTVQF